MGGRPCKEICQLAYLALAHTLETSVPQMPRRPETPDMATNPKLLIAFSLGLLACGDDNATVDSSTDGGGGGSMGGSGGTDSTDAGTASNSGSGGTGSTSDGASGSGGATDGASDSDGGASSTSGSGAGSDTDASSGSGGSTSGGTSGGTTGSSTGTGETTGTSGGSTGTGTTGPTCQPYDEQHVLDAVPASVMFVLDKSGSMSRTWDHDGDSETGEVSRWYSLYQVVDYIMGAYGSAIDFGAQLAPAAEAGSRGEGACDLAPGSPEVSAGPDNGAAILAGIPGESVEVFGGTPTSAGFDSAVAHLLTLDSQSPKSVILVTDGAANCKAGTSGNNLNRVYDDSLPGRVQAARETHRVLTYAIGVAIRDQMISTPATNPHVALEAVAEAGGAPSDGATKYYLANDQVELANAMATVTGAIECTVPLNVEAPHPNLVTIDLDGVEIPQVADCDTESGWVWTSGAGPFDAIILCGSACVPSGPVTQVDVHGDCP